MIPQVTQQGHFCRLQVQTLVFTAPDVLRQTTRQMKHNNHLPRESAGPLTWLSCNLDKGQTFCIVLGHHRLLPWQPHTEIKCDAHRSLTFSPDSSHPFGPFKRLQERHSSSAPSSSGKYSKLQNRPLNSHKFQGKPPTWSKLPQPRTIKVQSGLLAQPQRNGTQHSVRPTWHPSTLDRRAMVSL